MKARIQQAINKWQEYDFNKKAIIFTTGAVGIAATAFSIHTALKPDYTLLLSEVKSNNISSVLLALDGAGIAYQVGQDGNVFVDNATKNRAIAVLAKNGLPENPIDGYAHLSTSQPVYTSQSKENLFNTQVLEEEIAKLIKAIDGVNDAKIKLALTKESQFLRDSSPASASVVLTLDKTTKLTKKQVTGIINIVASAVSNLPIGNVVILDQTGRMLSNISDDIYAGSNQMEYKLNIEKNIESKIVEIIAPLVGVESIRVNVNANFNFDKTENTKEEPIERTVVLSEQSETVFDDSLSGGQGVPGSLSNQPPSHAKFDDKSLSSNQGGLSVNKSHEKLTKNYSVGKSITHTKSAIGNLNNLTVAVLIDKSKIETEKFDEVIAGVGDLINSSIGISTERGDVVTVTAIEFKKESIEPVIQNEFYETKWFEQCIDAGKWVAGFLAFWFMIWRPLLNRIAPPVKKDEAEPEITVTEEDLINNEMFDIDTETDCLNDQEQYQNEQNKAYKILEQQQDLAFEIVNKMLLGEELKTQYENSDLGNPDELDFTSEEELAAQMIEENKMLGDGDK